MHGMLLLLYSLLLWLDRLLLSLELILPGLKLSKCSSCVPSEPDPASSAQVWQVERGLSVGQEVLNWSYRPHGYVVVEASKEYPGSHHLSYRWGRSRPSPPAEHLTAPQLLLCP